MKDLQHYKDAVSQKHFDIDFRRATNVLGRDAIIMILEEAAHLYAEQCCKEQREACANNAILGGNIIPIVDKQSILNTPLITDKK